MAPDSRGGLRNSSPSFRSNDFLKKGPWTTAEDMVLIEYVKMHGEGNWNAVQKHSGLLRCGKSCRLRWANHLRPNLKKGSFTTEEEILIVDLHSKLGNKWARMAAQLPGRTDNEIKNYWNTRFKRRQRASLPIYPHESIIEKQQQQQQQQQLRKQHSHDQPDPTMFTFGPSLITNQESGSAPPYLNLYRDSHGGVALALDGAGASTLLFNQGVVNDQLQMTSLVQFNSLGYGVTTVPEMGALGLQSPAQGSSGELVVTSDGSEDCEVERGCKGSGLLQDLFGKSEEPYFVSPTNVHEEDGGYGYDHGIANSDDHYEGSQAKATSGESNVVAMDDDIMNLLDNFPLAVPIPDWDGGDGRESPILTKGTTGAVGSQPSVSGYNPIASFTGAANQDWNFGPSPYLWNNMPSIY